MPSTDCRQAAGKRGEDLACAELQRRGYAISARRYRSRYGEIDIVAERHGTIVFVEVKARTSGRRGMAAESIPLWKRRRIGAMALDYLAWTGRTNARCRFDVVAIDGLGTTHETLRVIEDAFHW
jgi:putative endonuclease